MQWPSCFLFAYWFGVTKSCACWKKNWSSSDQIQDLSIAVVSNFFLSDKTVYPQLLSEACVKYSTQAVHFSKMYSLTVVTHHALGVLCQFKSISKYWSSTAWKSCRVSLPWWTRGGSRINLLRRRRKLAISPRVAGMSNSRGGSQIWRGCMKTALTQNEFGCLKLIDWKSISLNATACGSRGIKEGWGSRGWEGGRVLKAKGKKSSCELRSLTQAWMETFNETGN